MPRIPEKPPYRFALFVAGSILALYLLTIAPTTQFWDTSEYIAAAKVLGIPHPPGNPLFVLVAHVWGMLPLASEYALRINIFSAFCGATAAGFLFLVADRFLQDTISEYRPRRLAAFAGILGSATSYTVWTQSVVNAKVYTLSLLFIALVLWLTVRWGDLRETSRGPKLIVLVAYLIVLGTTNHLMALLIAPAAALFIGWGNWRLLKDWRLLSAVGIMSAIALSVSLFMIVRAPLFPPINEGEPTTWTALWDVLMRKQYLKPPLMNRQAAFVSQLANYWQYFTWQFGKDWGPGFRNPVAVVFAVTGLYGGWRLVRTNLRAGITMLVAMFTFTIALVFYLNFKYGFSIYPGENLAREVRERDYFFVASFQLWGVWVAVGLGSIMGSVARLFGSRRNARHSWNIAVITLSLGLVPLMGNRLSAPRSGETLARDFAVDLLNSVQPYAILITAGDNDLFPLWYAQEVEGVRRDVVVANLSLLGTTWHLRQLQRRPIFPFSPGDRHDPWAGGDWIPPMDPLFSLSAEELDSLPPALRLEERTAVTVGNVRIVLEPGFITRSDIAVVQLIQDNLEKRPVYFAATTGGYPDGKGLGEFLLSNGLARRLMPNKINPGDSTYFSRSLGWIDLSSLEHMAFNVYHPESAARQRPRGWVDRPSSNVLALYGILYGELAEIMQGRARSSEDGAVFIEKAIRAQRIAEGVVANLERARD